MNEYGIVANISGVDRFARFGSKAFLVMSSGQGQSRMKWLVRTRNGSLAEKWLPTDRLNNFRCSFLPEYINSQMRMNKDDAIKFAKGL